MLSREYVLSAQIMEEFLQIYREDVLDMNTVADTNQKLCFISCTKLFLVEALDIFQKWKIASSIHI